MTDGAADTQLLIAAVTAQLNDDTASASAAVDELLNKLGARDAVEGAIGMVVVALQMSGDPDYLLQTLAKWVAGDESGNSS